MGVTTYVHPSKLLTVYDKEAEETKIKWDLEQNVTNKLNNTHGFYDD